MNVSRWIVALPVRLRSIVRRARAESDVEDELSFHLAIVLVESLCEARCESGVVPRSVPLALKDVDSPLWAGHGAVQGKNATWTKIVIHG